MFGKCSELVWPARGGEVGGAAAPVPNIFRTSSEHFHRGAPSVRSYFRPVVWDKSFCEARFRNPVAVPGLMCVQREDSNRRHCLSALSNHSFRSTATQSLSLSSMPRLALPGSEDEDEGPWPLCDSDSDSDDESKPCGPQVRSSCQTASGLPAKLSLASLFGDSPLDPEHPDFSKLFSPSDNEGPSLMMAELRRATDPKVGPDTCTDKSNDMDDLRSPPPKRPTVMEETPFKRQRATTRSPGPSSVCIMAGCGWWQELLAKAI